MPEPVKLTFNQLAPVRSKAPPEKLAETIVTGAAVGTAVGAIVGVSVGAVVGTDVGTAVGVAVGTGVGATVGAGVGVGVGVSRTQVPLLQVYPEEQLSTTLNSLKLM